MKAGSRKYIIAGVIIVFLLAAIVSFLITRKNAPPALNQASQEGNPTSTPPVVAPDLNEQTRNCGLHAPIDLNPKTGIREFSVGNSYVDYFYILNLKSVEKAKIKDCNFVKLGFVRIPEAASDTFSLYLPEKMPSLGTSENILPESMSQYVNKTLEFQVRYFTGPENTISEQPVGVLGWQLRIIIEPNL